MRKNSVRKWLHAILDLLPLFVIPIFAIYTRNENYNSNIEVQTYENKVVDFNQLYDYQQNTYTYMSTSDNNGLLTINIYNDTNTLQRGRLSQTIDVYLDHVYYYRILPLDTFDSLTNYTQIYLNIPANNYPNLSIDKLDTRFKCNVTMQTSINIQIQTQLQPTTFSCYINVFDLTQMFGVGNEPTTQDFLEYFPNEYYDFELSQELLIDNYKSITYNDTDVGSQFVYTLYNATDKYFNCTNLFNLEQVWNWVQLNLFGGNAPLMVYVVWQVIVYEFFMDLIFLLYSVFMFIIDFAQDCLEKPFNRIRRL